jgi:hypothetical protein
MRFFSWLWKLLSGWFVRKPAPYRAVFVEELPERLEPKKLYVEGEAGHVWAVAMVCPCGCGQALTMNMLPDAYPRWKLTVHDDQSVTMHPSVWRQVGCKSHFFLRHGMIEWCPEGVVGE